MKLYKVTPDQGEPEFIAADDWTLMEDQDQYVFLKNGKTVAFFVASAVKSIKEESDNYDPRALEKFIEQNQLEETYEDDYS